MRHSSEIHGGDRIHPPVGSRGREGRLPSHFNIQVIGGGDVLRSTVFAVTL